MIKNPKFTILQKIAGEDKSRRKKRNLRLSRGRRVINNKL